mmetsp:Transcript_7732/g.13038  ORF Transcript_7732/g.13038 Transcript_7732/m.13038 type:complete len:238 (+) Transcript_7732:66-779(+)
MSSRGVDREPCPYRIVDDAGNAFMFGFVGGSIWHFFGGIRNAPSHKKIPEMVWARVATRVPILGGSFAVWGTVFSCCDCTMAYARKKEDPWNAISAGFLTGGILAARAGAKQMVKNAVVGGVILGLIEGVSIGVSRVLLPMYEQQAEEQGHVIDMLDPPVDPLMRRGRTNARDMYNPIPIMPSASGGGSGGSLGSGFDLDKISSFDSEVSKSDDFSSTSSSEDSTSSSSSWYNPFGK